MGLFINTNTASINGRRRLSQSSNAMSRSFERLSSGLRINSAKDDAAGLAISNRMTAQIRGLDQAVRNSNDGISMAQTAEGALNETTNILQRIRELSVQAASDSNNLSDRQSLQEEVSQLVAEVDRISESTSFNGVRLLNGDVIDMVYQVGANVGENLQVGIDKMDAEELGRQVRRVSKQGVDTTFAIDATHSLQIGGIDIRGSVATDDDLSTSNKAGSAISKAASLASLQNNSVQYPSLMDIGVLFHRTPSGPPTACRPFFLRGPAGSGLSSNFIRRHIQIVRHEVNRGPLSTKFQIPTYRSRSWVRGRQGLRFRSYILTQSRPPSQDPGSGSVTRNSESQKLHSTYGARTFHEPRIGICNSESGISEATFLHGTQDPKIRRLASRFPVPSLLSGAPLGTRSRGDGIPLEP